MSMSAEAKARKAEYNRAYRLANKEKLKEKCVANKEKIAEYGKAYRLANKEKIAERTKDWRAVNKEKRTEAQKVRKKEYDKAYRSANKEQTLDYAKTYYQDNKDIMGAKTAKRRAAKLERTVAWSDADAIKSLYTEAHRLTAETGEQHHVDHIIPLQGVLVSGLHVENNLQVLTAYANLSKSNTFNIEERV